MLRVLIVDDNEDCRAMYSRYLTHVGMEAHTAASGTEGVRAAVELMPDVVVMDLSMPGLDGWRALRRLKADRRTRAVPVVAITGQGDGSLERHTASAGFVRFCRKPCLPATLAAIVTETARRGDEQGAA